MQAHFCGLEECDDIGGFVHSLFIKNSQVMYLAIFGLIAVLLLVFLVLSAKTWNWVHIVALFFVFGAMTAWGVSASKLFSYREAWMKQLAKNEQLYAQAKEAHREALYGDVAAGDYGAGSLYATQQSLIQATSERGRVWSNGTVSQTDNVFEVTFAGAGDPAAGEANPATLEQDMIVFAFKYRNTGGVDLPVEFQGVFHVVEVNGNVARMELAQEFINIEVSANGQWALYENMPLDRHGIFKNRLGITDANFDADEFRNGLKTYFNMDGMFIKGENGGFAQWYVDRYLRLYVPEGTEPPTTEEFTKMLADKFGIDVPPAGENEQKSVRELAFDKMLDQYVYDGRSLDEIEQLDPSFEVTDENMDVDLRFTENSKSYRVDGTGDINSAGRIDNNGLTIDPALQHGGEIVLPKDRLVRADKTSLNKYTDGNTVEEEKSYFRRPLHDYNVAFSMYSDTSNLLDRTIERIVDQNREFTLTLADSQTQLEHRNSTIMSLDEDSNKFDAQLVKATEMVQKRHTELGERYAEFERLYKLVGVMSKQLKEKTTAIRDEMDRRTKEVTKK